MDEIAAAYEGLEGDFADRATVEAYRATVLQRSAPQAHFVAARLRPGASVVEVGTGNGRLLVELARRGVAPRALGIDLAASRIAFAQAWAQELSLDGLRFVAGDALAEPLGADHDAALVITGALGYFDAFAPGSALALLRRVRAAVRPGALLVLELYPHPQWRRMLDAAGGAARLWQELPEGDPWRFYLSDLELDGGVLTHRKTFVHRTEGTIDEGRSERLRLYDADELAALAAEAGFAEPEAFEGWTADPYTGGEVLVLTARARPA